MLLKKISQIVRIGILISPLFLLSIQAKEIAIGDKAPDFSLQDYLGRKHALSQYQGKFVVLEWVNHGCPFVQKHYNSKNMQNLQKEAKAKGVIWLSIASSGQGKQGYFTPQEWSRVSQEKGSEATAVLLDYEGKVGKAFGAKTTPHMFVIDPKGLLIYQGAIDDRPSTEIEDVAGANNYVRQVLSEALAGKPITVKPTTSYGCSVKYK